MAPAVQQPHSNAKQQSRACTQAHCYFPLGEGPDAAASFFLAVAHGRTVEREPPPSSMLRAPSPNVFHHPLSITDAQTERAQERRSGGGGEEEGRWGGQEMQPRSRLDFCLRGARACDAPARPGQAVVRLKHL